MTRSFPAQVLAAECGDVAGDEAAADGCVGFSRTEQVRVGVVGRHLQDA